METTRASVASALVFAVLTTGALGAQTADSKYDIGTTVFSPKGRLYQVEYAAEAVNRARPAVGICTDEGVVLCSLKTIYNTRLQVADQREKTSRIDAHAICASAGLTADAMVLVRDCRASAQQHSLTFQEPIPVQKLASHLADVKQAYTQHGGLRPWGVSMLLAGWDQSRGFQLYKTEPSGNFGAFKAVAIGAGAARLSSELASAYQEAARAASGHADPVDPDATGMSSMGLEDAVRLAARVLHKERVRERESLEKVNSVVSGDDDGGGGSARGDGGARGIGMEIATISLTGSQEDGKATVRLYKDADVESLLISLDYRDSEPGDAGGAENAEL